MYEGMEKLKSCCNICSVIGGHVTHIFHFSWDPGQVPVDIRVNDFGEVPHAKLWAILGMGPYSGKARG